jgi:hypothetical protein
MTVRDKIETSQDNARSHQQADEEPKRRPFGQNYFPDRPPKATEKYRA